MLLLAGPNPAPSSQHCMTEERIAIIDLADELQVRKQRIFKVPKRLGIQSTQRRESSRGNQNVATVTLSEAAAIREELSRSSDSKQKTEGSSSEAASILYADDIGVFYLQRFHDECSGVKGRQYWATMLLILNTRAETAVIQLEPNYDPSRFKVGFTTEIDGRLRKHRCSAPFAQCLKTWPCRRTWERAAIDCVTDGCEQLHTEVFRAVSLENVAARAEAFFSVMPALGSSLIEGNNDVSEDITG